MKRILVLLLLAISIASFGQDCSFKKKDKIDPYSNLPVKMQQPSSRYFSNVMGSSWIKMYYCTNHKWIHLLSEWKREYGREFSFGENDPIIFYFSDSTTLRINVSPDYLGTSESESYHLTEKDIVVYDVQKSDVEILANKKVAYVKVYYSYNNYHDKQILDDEFKQIKFIKFGADTFNDLSKCILTIY